MEEENLRIHLAEGRFAETQIEWRCHRITQRGKTPLANKTATIQQLDSPTNL